MASFDPLGNLPLELESYELEGLEYDVGRFVRKTTVVHLRGGGQEGIGEDVTYDAHNQESFQAQGGELPVAGSHTLDGFSELLEHLSLFPTGPGLEAYRDYRRWAFESAALDLALRQAGTSLGEALERESQPVRFVVSMGLPDPPSADPVKRWLAADSSLRFKLDPRPTWDDALVTELVETGAVDTLDLKGAYKGTPVDNPGDPTLYARMAMAFPGAWLEDPDLNEDTDPVLEPHRHRITWDAPIHSVADIEGLPFPPRCINIKPSRFGSIRRLLDTYDYCQEKGIRMYGGGQFELGPGRGQIQYLASLFHPDSPNDVAPREYNLSEPGPGLPRSPLEPAPEPIGFRSRG
jgi:hypothetical protein